MSEYETVSSVVLHHISVQNITGLTGIGRAWKFNHEDVY